MISKTSNVKCTKSVIKNGCGIVVSSSSQASDDDIIHLGNYATRGIALHRQAKHKARFDKSIVEPQSGADV